MSNVVSPIPQVPLSDIAQSAIAAMSPPDAVPYGPGRRLGVSFSGGVDSAVVLVLAVEAFGPEAVVALIAVSPSLARRELRAARETAAEIGVELAEVATFETDIPDYRANRADRCFHCRTEMFTRFTGQTATELGLAAIAYGENSSDVDRIDRPGAAAARDFGVLRPLAAAGIDKKGVRKLAREFGLSVADKPASPCLASRVPHGVEVTPELLRQIDDAEDAVIEAGFPEARVRHHGEIARIEVPAADLVRLATPRVRARVVDGVRAAGYRHVTMDLAGLQSGAFTLHVIGRRNDS
ncbi:MAG TPA: ATP-dependent sacrificial sulfur transferase LarE [Actinomycetaceae bacterium]|nr:ATP-dependent sacrificial sulfur transferase LarE [Actinomycetaceae bacterium]